MSRGRLLYAKVKHESTTAGVMLVGKANQEAIHKHACGVFQEKRRPDSAKCKDPRAQQILCGSARKGNARSFRVSASRTPLRMTISWECAVAGLLPTMT